MGIYLLGIDIGTSACKAAVFDTEGNVLASRSEEYEVFYPSPGWAEQNPNDWWGAVCHAIRQVLEQSKINSGEIVGIGVDGQSWSAIPVDRKGNVLAHTPIWMDTRASDICQELNSSIGAERIFETAGNSLQPSYSTAKVIWYKRNLPDVYRNTYKILQSNGYIAFMLTGNMTMDISQGYGWHCFDMKKGSWDLPMCRELGIPSEFLPEISACHSVIGRVTEKASGMTGLLQGTPVVAGGLDAACGTLGAGVIHAGETQEQGGQAGGMSICIKEYKADPRLILSYHVVPGLWLLQGGTTGGGGVMRWLEKELGEFEREEGRKLGRTSLSLLDERAEAVNPGCDGLVFLPYMAGERSPIWNPHAKGVYFGLDYRKTKGHLIRAAMEGVAMSVRHNLDIARQAGVEVSVLHSMGGAANSLLWTQMKSDITGKPIEVPASDTATTLGAAVLAGVGVGVYPDFDEAVKSTVKNNRYHVPNEKNKQVYDRNYRIYRKLYEQLESIMGNQDEKS